MCQLYVDLNISEKNGSDVTKVFTVKKFDPTLKTCFSSGVQFSLSKTACSGGDLIVNNSYKLR